MELHGAPGVARVVHDGAWELHLKSIKMEKPEDAVRAAEVSFGLIRGLYSPKKNPYEGEVTSLIKCDKKFWPGEFAVKCPNGQAKGIAGGVGERRAFGACAGPDIRQTGVFFSCYDPALKILTEVRAFRAFKGPWASALSDAKAWAGKLFP